jgi:DNA-binding transcriptional LysR family regulator
MLDTSAIETFVAVARAGSVQRAAERLHRAQPSVSARLASLEERWGTKLFRRHARGMALTPEGARLLPLAEAALEQVSALDGEAGLPVSARGELRIGAGDALGREVVPVALARLLRSDPALQVRLVEGSSARLLDALRAGEIDLALVAAQAAEAAPAAGVDTQPLLESAVDALFPPGERRVGASIELERLRGRRIVALQPGSAFRRHLEDAFALAGIPFRPAVEVGNLSLVRRFVVAGLGVAPVPAVAFRRGRATSRARLEGVGPVHYALARRSGVAWSAAAARFLEMLRRER